MWQCTVFLLNAAVFVDLAFYLAVCGSASVESFALLPFSCFGHVWHRFAGCLPLELFTLSLSSSPARDLQHTTLRLSCCLLQVGHQQNLDFAASHHLGHLCFSWHVRGRDSFLRNVGLFLKLRYVEEFPGCRRFIGDVSRKELEMQIRLVFSLKSHAPRVTERQCLLVTGLIRIRSFTILLFTGETGK